MRRLQINLNMSNRWLYTFITIGVLVLAGVFVYAGNVFVTDGNLDVGNDLNVSDVFYVNSSSGIVSMPKQSGCRVRLTNDQTIPSSVDTKLQFGTEDWDIQNEFDNVTNYRFTATKTGLYQINLNVMILNVPDLKNLQCFIFKNGAKHSRGKNYIAPNIQSLQADVSDILYLDVGDYVEGFMWHNSGSDKTASEAGGINNYMSIQKIA